MPVPLFAANPANCDHLISPNQILTKHGPLTITNPEALILLEDQITIGKAMELHGEERRDALKKYFTQRPVTRSQVAATFLNYAVAIGMAYQVKEGFQANPGSMLNAAAFAAPTLLVSDLISRVYHLFLDVFASETHPIWGHAARAFRIHHEFQSNLNDLSYIDNIAPFGKLMLPFYLTGAGVSQVAGPDVSASILLMLILFSNGTEIHRQAHLPKANMAFRALQKIRLVLTKNGHRLHHGDTNSDYGIINGWTNAPFRTLDQNIDAMIWKAMRKLPRNWMENPSLIPDEVIEELMKDIDSIPQQLFIYAANPRNADARVDELMRLWIERHPVENAPLN